MDNELKQFLTAMEERLTEVAKATEQRLEGTEQRLEGTEQRLEAMEQRLEGKIDASADRLRTELGDKIRESETKLLSAFHGWARSMEIRVRSTSSNVSTLDERLTLAEERISELERHKAS
jgi:hypothetical protein